ncbi:hypothetical protein [Campylobacter sputorum]|nr:hypothetical protein [Campylobacter sputorum]
MKKFLAFLVFITPIFLFALDGKVVRVVDGDTIVILTSKKNK